MTEIFVPPASVSVVASLGYIVAPTIRARIIHAFADAMADVTIDNGYHTDAGKNVILCRRSLDPAELPCIVILPGMETAERLASGYCYCTMRLGVESHAIFGAVSASVISENMLGDMLRALFGQSITTLADDIQYESGGIDSYPESGEVAIGVKVNLNIKYNYLIGDPYSQ